MAPWKKIVLVTVTCLTGACFSYPAFGAEVSASITGDQKGPETENHAGVKAVEGVHDAVVKENSRENAGNPSGTVLSEPGAGISAGSNKATVSNSSEPNRLTEAEQLIPSSAGSHESDLQGNSSERQVTTPDDSAEIPSDPKSNDGAEVQALSMTTPGESIVDENIGEPESSGSSSAHTERPVETSALEPLYVKALNNISTGYNDSSPVWSPSGHLIAYERSTGDKREIIISRQDGSVVQKIYFRLPKTDGDMDFIFPGVVEEISYNSGIAWAPDENSLVFMSNGGRGNYDLYLLPLLGSDETIRLTNYSEKDSHPHWSPRGDQLAFVSGRTGKAEIYLMDLKSRKTSNITSGKKTYLYPQWSPDGQKITMIYGSNENHDIFLIEDINKPGETLRALTTWEYDDLRPVWSPDGSMIAFYSNYNLEDDPKRWSIVVIPADGSIYDKEEDLADKIVARDVIPDIERGPAWMPDSSRIVYIKNDEQAYNPIHVVDIKEGTDRIIKTETKMNHNVACSVDGILAFRAQTEQWDHIYIAKLKD